MESFLKNSQNFDQQFSTSHWLKIGVRTSPLSRPFILLRKDHMVFTDWWQWYFLGEWTHGLGGILLLTMLVWIVNMALLMMTGHCFWSVPWAVGLESICRPGCFALFSFERGLMKQKRVYFPWKSKWLPWSREGSRVLLFKDRLMARGLWWTATTSRVHPAHNVPGESGPFAGPLKGPAMWTLLSHFSPPSIHWG